MAYTTFNLNVDDTILQSSIEALCWKGGYQAEVTDTNPTSPTYNQQIANPISPTDGAKAAVIAFIENTILDYNNMLAQQAVVPPVPGLIS